MGPELTLQVPIVTLILLEFHGQTDLLLVGEPLQGVEFAVKALNLFPHPLDVLLDLVEVLVFLALFVLKVSFLFQAFDATTGRVTAILQRPPSGKYFRPQCPTNGLVSSTLMNVYCCSGGLETTHQNQVRN